MGKKEKIIIFQRADGKGHVFLEYKNSKYDIFRVFKTKKEAFDYLKKINKSNKNLRGLI